MKATERVGFPVTVHIQLHQLDRVLLLKRQNTGYRDGWFSLIAGHVELGEQLTQAAVREVSEEVGLEVDGSDLQLCGVMHRRSADQRVDFFFEVHSWVGSPHNREPEKCSEIVWFPLSDIPSKTIPYIRHALAKPSGALWWDEFGWD